MSVPASRCRAAGGRLCLAAALAIAAGRVGVRPAGAENWLITPRIEGQELFTDNVLATPTNTRADLVTTLSPGVEVSAEGSRLMGKLDYSPTFYLYAFTPGQNAIGHNLYANGTAVIDPGLLFFDAHAYASLQPVTPGLATTLSPGVSPTGLATAGAISPFVPTILPKAQLTQVTTVIASPYVQQRFGDYGVGELRYTFADDNFSGGQNVLLPAGIGNVPASSDITNEGTATFLTGRYFDRFTSRVLLDSAQSSGSGVLDNASQNRAIVATEFPLVRRLAALTTIGYEDLRFSGIPPVRINDAVWGVGVRFAPTPNRTVTFIYGRHEGITSPYLALDYALTPLTRIAASYSDSLSTFSQDIERNLLMSNLTAQGQTVNAQSLLPLPIHNPLLGLQLSLLRVKQATATGYLDYKRDHFSLAVDREEDSVIAEATPQSGTSVHATSMNIGWVHDISPLASAQVGAGYSWVTLLQAPEVREQILVAGASLSYQFNGTLSGSAGYTYFNRAADNPLFKLNTNIVLVSLRKTF
jgi:uncharacterized protein (PEP-CTERM system associated)